MPAYLEQAKNFLIGILPKLCSAVFIIIIGYLVTKLLVKLLSKTLKKSRLDISLHTFFLSATKIALLFVVVIIAASSLGINTSSFVTILGAVGLALSLALKDSLANLASGLLVLMSHPFHVNDYIETDGVSGKVMEIGLIYTRLNTLDNKQIYLPNKQVTNAKIINYSAETIRRLDLIFTISSKTDVDQAKEVVAQVVSQNALALPTPEPTIRVCSYNASTVDIAVKVWVKTEDYSNLNFDLHEQMKKAFEENKISLS